MPGNNYSLYRFLVYLEKLSTSFALLISLVLVMILGLIDYQTGFELSFSFFYLVPVSIAAWGIGQNAGVMVSGLSAIVWAISNLAAGESHSSMAIIIWNTIMRLGFFCVVTILLHTLKQEIRYEQTLARTDPLTGALNRRSFYDIIATKVIQSKFHQRTFTLAYIDLDNFKQINDQKGHIMGDAVLKTVVETTQNNIRGKDFLARLGGDEFALLLTETNATDAKPIIERLQSKLLGAMQDQEWNITFSIGVMTFMTFPTSISKMIGLTDQLMYEVKSHSKNSVLYSIYNEIE